METEYHKQKYLSFKYSHFCPKIPQIMFFNLKYAMADRFLSLNLLESVFRSANQQETDKIRIGIGTL